MGKAEKEVQFNSDLLALNDIDRKIVQAKNGSLLAAAGMLAMTGSAIWLLATGASFFVAGGIAALGTTVVGLLNSRTNSLAAKKLLEKRRIPRVSPRYNVLYAYMVHLNNRVVRAFLRHIKYGTHDMARRGPTHTAWHSVRKHSEATKWYWRLALVTTALEFVAVARGHMYPGMALDMTKDAYIALAANSYRRLRADVRQAYVPSEQESGSKNPSIPVNAAMRQALASDLSIPSIPDHSPKANVSLQAFRAAAQGVHNLSDMLGTFAMAAMIVFGSPAIVKATSDYFRDREKSMEAQLTYSPSEIALADQVAAHAASEFNSGRYDCSVPDQQLIAVLRHKHMPDTIEKTTINCTRSGNIIDLTTSPNAEIDAPGRTIMVRAPGHVRFAANDRS